MKIFWGVGRVLGVVELEEEEGEERDDLAGEGADSIAGGCADYSDYLSK